MDPPAGGVPREGQPEGGLEVHLKEIRDLLASIVRGQRLGGPTLSPRGIGESSPETPNLPEQPGFKDQDRKEASDHDPANNMLAWRQGWFDGLNMESHFVQDPIRLYAHCRPYVPGGSFG